MIDNNNDGYAVRRWSRTCPTNWEASAPRGSPQGLVPLLNQVTTRTPVQTPLTRLPLKEPFRKTPESLVVKLNEVAQ